MRKSVYSEESRLLAESVTEARKRAGMHQADVAAKMGSDQTAISNIERGHRRIDAIEFFEFANAVDCDPVELYRSIVEKWRGLPR